MIRREWTEQTGIHWTVLLFAEYCGLNPGSLKGIEHTAMLGPRLGKLIADATGYDLDVLLAEMKAYRARKPSQTAGFSKGDFDVYTALPHRLGVSSLQRPPTPRRQEENERRPL